MHCPGRFVTDSDGIGKWDPSDLQSEFHVIAPALPQIYLSAPIEDEIWVVALDLQI